MGIESGTLPIQCSSQWVICGNSTELADGDWEWKRYLLEVHRNGLSWGK